MKKSLILISFLFLSYTTIAQDITDALRYSNDEIQGTARFRAMSGAFGALGGDMSAININPAGSAIFNISHLSVSLGGTGKGQDVSYFGTTNSDANTFIDLNQFGAALVFNNTNSESKWKKYSLALAYDKTGDLNNDWFASGINTTIGSNQATSIAEYFVQYANGLRLDEISAFSGESISQAYSEIGSAYGYGNQQAFLGYEGFIIDPELDTDENTQYTSNINGDSFSQRYAYNERGYNGKMAFNVAANYDNKFYFGANLNVHFIDYQRTTFFNESNSNASSLVTNVDFDNTLVTTGGGFSFQLGGIAKLTDALRVGLAYNSPTWYRISDETSQYLATTRVEGGNLINQVVNPNVVNIYEEYRLQTPSKLTGSLAYVFGKKGLLSLDYAVKDYSNITFRSNNNGEFSGLNTQISDVLDTTVMYKIGGEYKHKQLSFRGGYRFEESPYKNINFYGDLSGYSLGLGYSFGEFNIDLAFSQSQQDINQQLFNIGLTDAVFIESKLTDIILSATFNL